MNTYILNTFVTNKIDLFYAIGLIKHKWII